MRQLPSLYFIVTRRGNGSERFLAKPDGTVTGYLSFDAAFVVAKEKQCYYGNAYVVTLEEKTADENTG